MNEYKNVSQCSKNNRIKKMNDEQDNSSLQLESIEYSICNEIEAMLSNMPLICMLSYFYCYYILIK